MRKNLFDDGVAKQTADRLSTLTPVSVPLWGSMNAIKMLHHLNGVLHATLEGKQTGKPSTIKQQFIKFLFLNLISRFPKNVAAPEKLRVTTEIPVDRFEIEKQHCINLINNFAGITVAIEATHPAFGKLNTREWGYFTWMHLDHHLRQFGI